MSVSLYETAHLSERDGATVVVLRNFGEAEEIAAPSDVVVLDLETGRHPADVTGRRHGVLSVKPDQIEVYAPYTGGASMNTTTVFGRLAVVADPLEV